MAEIEAKIGPEIIRSYKRLSYSTWYALAELVDNSTQAYFNNREILDSDFTEKNSQLTIAIVYSNTLDKPLLSVIDNSIGMNLKELTEALEFGIPSENSKGRSKYGLGLKTSASWLGGEWKVITSKLGECSEHSIIFNVERIASGDTDLRYSSKDANSDSHYTRIEISKLNRSFNSTTQTKIKSYLASMFRHDINKFLNLNVFSSDLNWDYQENIYNRLRTDINNKKFYRKFKFCFNEEKNIIASGWCGVFQKGGRKRAGFSLIQSNRVIEDWNPGYRPESLFGDTAGGRNDLVNQRLVGEIFLNNFDVSHTKDKIIFSETEEEQLDNFLAKEFNDFRNEAAEPYGEDNIPNQDEKEIISENAIKHLDRELRSNKLRDYFVVKEVLPIEIIEKVFNNLYEDVISSNKPKIEVRINDIEVTLYLVTDRSINDQYLIIKILNDKNTVAVIVNQNHPHWDELNNEESILNFLRHCVYDGVAEYKARLKVDNIEPDTIKSIKDGLLRVPFLMKERD